MGRSARHEREPWRRDSTRFVLSDAKVLGNPSRRLWRVPLRIRIAANGLGKLWERVPVRPARWRFIGARRDRWEARKDRCRSLRTRNYWPFRDRGVGGLRD